MEEKHDASVDRAAEAKRLREARRESRRRNIGLHGAERLRRIQGEFAAPTKPEISDQSLHATDEERSLTLGTATSESSGSGTDLTVVDGHSTDGSLVSSAKLVEASPIDSSVPRSADETPDVQEATNTRRTTAGVFTSQNDHTDSAAVVSGGRELVEKTPLSSREETNSESDSVSAEAAGEEADLSSDTRARLPEKEIKSRENPASWQDERRSKPRSSPSSNKEQGAMAQFEHAPMMLTLVTICCAVSSVLDKLSLPFELLIFGYAEMQVIKILHSLCWTCLVYLMLRSTLRSFAFSFPSHLADSVESLSATVTAPPDIPGPNMSEPLVLIPRPVQSVLTLVALLSRWYEPIVTQCSVYLLTLIAVHQLAAYYDLIK